MSTVLVLLLALLLAPRVLCEGTGFTSEAGNNNGDEGRCGVIWFLHIGKTGGTTVQWQFGREARKNKALTYVSLFEGNRSSKWKWDESEEYAQIQAQVFGTSRPQLLVNQHHGTPGMTPEFLNDHLRPLACEAYRKGCNFTVTTLIRDPLSHIRSVAISKHHLATVRRKKIVDKFSFEANVKNCHTDFQSSYIAHGSRGTQSPKLVGNLTSVTTVLRDHFSLVGNTENLDEFLEDMFDMGLGIKFRGQNSVRNKSPVGSAYASAFDIKYLDDIAACVAKDSLLYADFKDRPQKTTEPRFSCPS